jgi:hypothetical protein
MSVYSFSLISIGRWNWLEGTKYQGDDTDLPIAPEPKLQPPSHWGAMRQLDSDDLSHLLLPAGRNNNNNNYAPRARAPPAPKAKKGIEFQLMPKPMQGTDKMSMDSPGVLKAVC